MLACEWGNTKLVSFTTDSEYEPVQLEIWSDHAYFLNALPKEFLKAEAQELSCKREDIVAGLKRKPTDLPASQYWDPFTKLQCGHFKSTDLQTTRRKLLNLGISPKVSLNGVGKMKRLLCGECIIHNWPAASHVCVSFLEKLSLVTSHNLVYRGESLAACTVSVFDLSCEIEVRPSLGFNLRNRIAESEKNVCAICGIS